jgi:hypothetical protein
MTLDVSGTTGVPSRSDPLCMEHRYDQHLRGSYAHVSCGSCFEFDKFIIVWSGSEHHRERRTQRRIMCGIPMVLGRLWGRHYVRRVRRSI